MAEPLDFSAFAEPEPTEPLDFSAFSDPDPGGVTQAAEDDDGPGAFMRGFVTTTREQNPELLASFLEGASYRAPEGLQGVMRQGAVDMRGFAATSPEEYKPHTDNLVDSLLSGDIGTWVLESIGSGIASTVPTMVAAAPGAIAGHRVAGKTGAFVGGATTAYAAGFVQNYGEIYQALIDEKVDPARAGDVAWMATPLVAALDTYTPGKLIARLGGLKEVKKEAARRFARRFVEEGLSGAKDEFVTEAAQKVVSDATVSLETDKPFWTAKNVEGWIEEGVAGGLTGGVLRGAAGIKKDRVTPSGNTGAPPLEIPPVEVDQGAGGAGGEDGEDAGVMSVKDIIAQATPQPTAAKPEAVAPQQGTGTTGNPTKPAENVAIGNPNSAPTRSATTAPKVGPKGKRVRETMKQKEARAERAKAAIIKEGGTPTYDAVLQKMQELKAQELALDETMAASGVSAEHSVALAGAKAPAAPQAAPEVTPPAPVAPVDDGAAEMAKRFAPLNAPQTAPAAQPIDTPAPAPVTVAAPLATPEEAITPVEETESGTPEPVGVSAPLDFSDQAEPEVVEPVAPLPTPSAPTKVGPKGRRILLDKSKNEEGKTKTQVARAQERSALNANLTDKTAGPKGTKHEKKEIKEARIAGRSAAQKLMDDNKPSEAEAAWADKNPAKANAARQAIFQRVEKFLAAVPDVVKKNVLKGDPETFPAPEVMVREALDFTKALKERDPKLHRDIFLRYLDREMRIRSGDVASVLRDRRDEGDQRKKAQQKGVEQIAAPTGDVSIESRAEAEAAPEPTAIPDQVAEPVAPEEEGADAAAARPAPENIAATKEQEDTFEGRGTKVARSIKTFDEETAERIAKESKGLSADEKARVIAEMNAKLAGEQAPRVTPKGKAKVEEIKAKSEPAPAVQSKAAPIIERVKKRKVAKPPAGPTPRTYDGVYGGTGYTKEERLAQVKLRIGQIERDRSASGWKAGQEYPLNHTLAKLRKELGELREEIGKARLAREIWGDEPAPGPQPRKDTSRNWNTNDDRKWLAKNANLMRDVYSAWTGKRAIANHSASLETILTGLFSPEKMNRLGVHMSRNQRAMADKMMDFMRKAVGHVEVHFVDQADVDNLLGNEPGEHSGGYYDPTGDFIVITDAAVDGMQDIDPVYLLEVILHEALHAATFHKLKHPKYRQLVESVMAELVAKHGGEPTSDPNLTVADTYGFKNADEFLAEAMSNRSFQNWLSTKKLSPGLAATLEMSHWKNATMWDAFVEMVRKFLGFAPNEHTALEAAISLTERVAYEQGIDGRAMTGREGITPDAYKFFDKMDASRREGAKLGLKKIMEIRNRQRAAQMKINSLDRPAPGPLPGPLPTRAELGGKVADHMSGFEAFRKRLWVQVITLDQMRQQFADSVFGSSLKQLTDAIANQGPTIQEFKQTYAPLAQEFIDYTRDNPREANTFARIALAVRAIDGHVVDGGDPATINQHAKNTHLGKRARRGWQPHALLPGLQRQYNAMSPEGRALFQKMAAFYAETHNRLASDSVRAMLSTPNLRANLNPATINGIVQRTLNEQLTESDEQILGGTLFHALEKEASFHKVKGMYFPEMRYGNHVVVTQDKITDTMGGTLSADGETVTFKGKTSKAADKLAEAFVRKSDLKHLSTKTVYFNALTGEQIDADQATGLNDVEYGTAVHMQTKGVHFFESHARAAEFIRLDPEGYGEEGFLTKTPEDRLGAGYQAHLLTGTQMATILSSINQRTDIEKHDKDMMRAILTQAAARMMSGNRVAHRRLKSQHVSGASTDFARNVFNYGEAAARHIATAKAMPKIRDAMNQMRAQLTDYYGKDRGDLDRVFNEVSKRVENGTIEPNEASPLMKNALALSFFARLASPAYTIINTSQVILLGLPVLGGRFGYGRASAAITHAYEDVGVGEAALTALVNTAKAGKGWNAANLVGVTDLVRQGRDRLAKLDDGADLAKMFDTLVEGNAISTEAGFEIGSAVAEGKGVVGTTIAKVDRIVRQGPQAAEYVNRTVMAVAAYRLARESGMDHDKATQFAFDAVKTTQGDYSNANAPRFFNHPWLRPAMQFRKYAQLVTYMLLDNVHRTFKGASREERVIAAKQLAGVLATQVAVAGAFSLPGLEFAKLAFMIGAALGLTDSWDDYEDEMREWADETFGKTWGEIVTSGGTRYFNIDVTGRMSLSDLWTFGGPDRNESESVQAYIFRQFIGSPGTLMVEFGEGLAKVAEGDFMKGAEKMIPFKGISDSVKALNRLRKGEGDLTDAALKVVGFRSANQAERDRETSRDIRAGYREQAKGKALGNEYRRAISAGAKAVVRAKIIAFNKSVKNYKNQVPYRRIDETRGKDYSKVVD
jgi:hypothetical protein